MNDIPVIYEREPIGVNGALEAVAVRYFCSEACRAKNRHSENDLDGTSSDFYPGTLCETCNKPIGA